MAGLGLVMWIAANWDELGRLGRFAVLQAAIVIAGGGALVSARARAPLALLALLGAGALFAYFGQTYQTGADPWQLFAMWAVLTLPLALAARSDIVWAPWAVVTMTAVALWLHAHSGHRWQVLPHQLPAHAIAWLAAAVLTTALGSALRRWTGAGVWSQRTAAVLAVVMVMMSALGGLFAREVAPHYGLGLALLAFAAAMLARPRGFEIFVLSAVALALNVLLVAGLARWVFDDRRAGDQIGRLMLIGLVAAALLAATVSALLRLSRRREAMTMGATR